MDGVLVLMPAMDLPPAFVVAQYGIFMSEPHLVPFSGDVFFMFMMPLFFSFDQNKLHLSLVFDQINCTLTKINYT